MHHIVTIIAKYFILIVLLTALAAWLKLNRSKKIDFVIDGVLVGILAIILAKIGAHLVSDPRPFVTGHFTPYFPHAADNGFPSDHTLFGSVVALVTLKYNRNLGIAAFVLAILLGLARVIAGVHHLLDIVASIVFAAIAFGIVNYARNRWPIEKSPSPRSRNGPTSP